MINKGTKVPALPAIQIPDVITSGTTFNILLLLSKLKTELKVTSSASWLISFCLTNFGYFSKRKNKLLSIHRIVIIE